MRFVLHLLICAACNSSGGRGDTGGATGGTTGGKPDLAMPQMMGDPNNYAVYANSDTELYRVDPDTLQVTLVAAFGWPNGSDQMTDIAIDKDGNMIGISFGSVYSVDKDTAKCTFLATLDREFNGLSFVPAQTGDPSSQEMLIASALDGSLYRLESHTGASTAIGNYGGGLTSSGDVVSVAGLGTLATVKTATGSSDWLATVDTLSGSAKTVGATGIGDIWGLGFWKDKIFGFTNTNQFVLIDPKTGSAQVVQTGNVSWWGAGVTTIAPVVQ